MKFPKVSTLISTRPSSIFLVVFLSFTFLIISGCGGSGSSLNIGNASTAFRIEDKLAEPFGIAIDGDTVFISDGNCGCIWRNKGSEITKFATDLATPSMIAIHPDGGLIVADSGSHTIKRIGTDGSVNVFGGISGRAGKTDGDSISALFHAPIGVAVDSEKRIWVTDTYNDTIRIIENGSVRTIAGSSRGFADGSGTSAKFDTPLGIAIDDEGRAIVADQGNRRLRIVTADGSVSTLAGNGEIDRRDGSLGNAAFVAPTGIATKGGTIFVTDGNTVRAIGLRSIPLVETIAGGDRGFRNDTVARSRFNRPSGIAIAADRSIMIADSENGLIRSLSDRPSSDSDDGPMRFTAAEFKLLAPGRWPYDPPSAKRDVAGTLGEIRGKMTESRESVWFHNGLDIAGNYGETARFIRDEKVLDPAAVDNFETLRELIRMPTLGYIHIRIGRRVDGTRFDDGRFLFDPILIGKQTGVRVARGTQFKAGEAIGTLNAMNHVHLIAGRRGFEFNALNALDLPGVADSRSPTVISVAVYDENWRTFETNPGDDRIIITGRFRPVLRTFDQMDGNPERRKLGVYKVGWQLLNESGENVTETNWTIEFDRLPEHRSLSLVYANGSHSGATGETIFDYIVSNRVNGSDFAEAMIESADLAAGRYILRLTAADIFGNSNYKDLKIEIRK